MSIDNLFTDIIAQTQIRNVALIFHRPESISGPPALVS